MHTYTQTYAHIHTQTHTPKHIHTYVHKHILIHTKHSHIHTNTHTHNTYTKTQTHTHKHIYTYTHTYFPNNATLLTLITAKYLFLTCYIMLLFFQLLPRHVSTTILGHLQGDRKFIDVCSLYVQLCADTVQTLLTVPKCN